VFLDYTPNGIDLAEDFLGNKLKLLGHYKICNRPLSFSTKGQDPQHASYQHYTHQLFQQQISDKELLDVRQLIGIKTF
jgi:hypothetical protein